MVCFSYLAAAELWEVSRFPAANQGAEVRGIEYSIAADAPMAAAVLSALGIPAVLMSNDVGDDHHGERVRQWLERFSVSATADLVAPVPTPQIVVIEDDDGTRTWFPSLPGVGTGLQHLDPAPLCDAAFAYVDCYQLIEEQAVRFIRAVTAAGVPLFLNLGGSPLSPLVARTVRGYPNLVIQTNVDDAAYSGSAGLGGSILAATSATWVIITAGAAGALMIGDSHQAAAPAFRVRVRHTHCAGAAFSGGLIYGLLNGWPAADCLALGSASGALRCERAHHEPMPTLAELESVIGSQLGHLPDAAALHVTESSLRRRACRACWK